MTDVIVLAGADERDLTQLDEYRAVGGYAQLERARGMAPAAVADELNGANLRGRGGAFFATGRKMQFIPSKEQNPKPHYVCINADESEPGTFKDREIMNRVPHRLIEGALIAAHAVDSQHVFIYIRGEYLDPFESLRARRISSTASRSSFIAVRARTSAVRNRGSSSRSRASAARRDRGRRFRRSPACTPRRR